MIFTFQHPSASGAKLKVSPVMELPLLGVFQVGLKLAEIYSSWQSTDPKHCCLLWIPVKSETWASSPFNQYRLHLHTAVSVIRTNSLDSSSSWGVERKTTTSQTGFTKLTVIRKNVSREVYRGGKLYFYLLIGFIYIPTLHCWVGEWIAL